MFNQLDTENLEEDVIISPIQTTPDPNALLTHGKDLGIAQIVAEIDADHGAIAKEDNRERKFQGKIRILSHFKFRQTSEAPEDGETKFSSL